MWEEGSRSFPPSPNEDLGVSALVEWDYRLLYGSLKECTTRDNLRHHLEAKEFIACGKSLSTLTFDVAAVNISHGTPSWARRMQSYPVCSRSEMASL